MQSQTVVVTQTTLTSNKPSVPRSLMYNIRRLNELYQELDDILTEVQKTQISK